MLSILHLHYLADYTNSDNPGVAIVPVIVIEQVELCWTLISATIPKLKGFVKSFGSAFGIQLDPALTQTYGSAGAGRTANRYEMNSIEGNGTAKSRSKGRSYNDPGEGPSLLTQDAQENKLTDNREHDSIDSGHGSQDHIIRKDLTWNVHYEMEPGRAL